MCGCMAPRDSTITCVLGIGCKTAFSLHRNDECKIPAAVGVEQLERIAGRTPCVSPSNSVRACVRECV